MSTLRKALADLLMGGSTPQEAETAMGCGLEYAYTVRRELVHEGKVGKGPERRGRPARKGVGK